MKHSSKPAFPGTLDQLFGGTYSSDLSATKSYGRTVKAAMGSVVVSQGEDVATVFRVARGYLRSCVYSEDGQRRIVSFEGPGSILGLGLSDGDRWPVSLEAVTCAELQAVPRRIVERAFAEDEDVRRDALTSLRDDIGAQQHHLVMMSIVPATERVRLFLKDFAAGRGHDGFLALPMCRRDIADYLGLSIETVSRSFTSLREAGKIALNGADKFCLMDADPDVQRAA